MATTMTAQGSIGVPQTNAQSSGTDWLAAVSIPAGARSIDFLLDVAAYVVADCTTADPSNTGVPYQPNLNFRLPCRGATKLHLRGVAASALLKWTVIM